MPVCDKAVAIIVIIDVDDVDDVDAGFGNCVD